MTTATRYLSVLAAGLLWSMNSSAIAEGNGLEELRVAYKEFTARKFSAVAKRLDQAIVDGKMSQASMARALYLRGRARQETGRTAEAIADLSAAIWFGKLPKNEQTEAMAQRRKAYQRLGVQLPSVNQARQTATAPTTQRPTRSTANRTAAPQAAPQKTARNWSQVVTGAVPNAPREVSSNRTIATTTPAKASVRPSPKSTEPGTWQTTATTQATNRPPPKPAMPETVWGFFFEQLTPPAQNSNARPLREAVQSQPEN